MSRFHFPRVFKPVTGVTPKSYADAQCVRRVREQPPQLATVTEAIYSAGFQFSGRFYAASFDLLGMQPSAFRAGGDGTSIGFGVGENSPGSILVAATERRPLCPAFAVSPASRAEPLTSAGMADASRHFVGQGINGSKLI